MSEEKNLADLVGRLQVKEQELTPEDDCVLVHWLDFKSIIHNLQALQGLDKAMDFHEPCSELCGRTPKMIRLLRDARGGDTPK